MRRLFTLLVLGLLPLLAWSQTRTITGKVVSSTAEPLIGVTVLVKGTNAGTVTDIEGNYSVNAPSDANWNNRWRCFDDGKILEWWLYRFD